MSDYRIYPAVDRNYNFPPQIRQSMASSPEVEAAVNFSVTQKVSTEVATVIADNPAVKDAAAALAQSNVGLVHTRDERLPQPASSDSYEDSVVDHEGHLIYGIRKSGAFHVPVLEVDHVEGASLASRHPEPEWSTKEASWEAASAAYNLHPRTLGRSRRAFAKALAGVGNFRITTLGDSRTRGALGTGTSYPKYRYNWPGVLHKDMLRTIDDGGTGTVPLWDEWFHSSSVDDRLSRGSGVTSKTTYGSTAAGYGAHGLACAIIDNSTGSGWVEFSPNQPVSEFTAVFISEVDTTSLATLKIDGQTIGTLSLGSNPSLGSLSRRSGTPSGYVVVDIPVSNGVHTLRVEGDPNGIVLLTSVEGSNPSGIQVSNIARSSTKLEHWIRDDSAGRLGMPLSIDYEKSDLVMVMPLSNDRKITPSVVSTRTRTLVNRAKAAGSDVVVILPCMPNFAASIIGGTEENWKALCSSIYALADELDFAIIDNTWSWESFNENPELFGDDIHENDAGSALIGVGASRTILGALK